MNRYEIAHEERLAHLEMHLAYGCECGACEYERKQIVNTKEKELLHAAYLVINSDLMKVPERKKALAKVDAIKKKYGIKRLGDHVDVKNVIAIINR